MSKGKSNSFSKGNWQNAKLTMNTESQEEKGAF
jgi:hypothetical protein